jgi:ABC-type phosphate/phosphonate transport system substrate-binding protein
LQETQGATDALWAHLAGRLRRLGFPDVPGRLRRDTSYLDQWTSGRLLFSQACGYDVLLPFRGHLRMIATPVYRAPGCLGPWYSSVVVVREDSSVEHLADLRGARCVINSATSHSGMNALRALVAPLHRGGRFFASVRVSHSHELSLRMISSGAADVAAVDGVTYALLARHRPAALTAARVLCCSSRIPAPPFVTSAGIADDDLRRMQDALFETLESPGVRAAREELLLETAEIVPLDRYQAIVEWEGEALSLGYAEILSWCGEESARRRPTKETRKRRKSGAANPLFRAEFQGS